MVNFKSLRGDAFGGVTAAIVALPLALAFGVASGAGALAGLYGAMFLGFFAALFGGTQTQISGPTGPMTVVMAGIILEFSASNPDQVIVLTFAVVVLSGLFQIAFGLLRLGRYITLVSYPVISGFMTGIGVIIILLQIAPLFGYEGSSSIVDSAFGIPSLISDVIASPQFAAIITGGLTLGILFFWPKVLSKWVPSALIALVFGTLVMVVIFPNSNLARIGEIPTAIPALKLPIVEFDMIKAVIFKALLLAGLGAIDSLMTSLVADNLTLSRHNSDKELIGQGIGNTISGLFGGLPGAGATMRTVVNIQAGGVSNLSGIIHALVLSVIVLGASFLVEDIPHVVLAGILLKVGFDIIDWQFLLRINRIPIFSASLMLGVAFITVFVDLMTAVFIGAFIANIVTIDRLSSLQVDGLLFSDGNLENSKLLAENIELKRFGGDVLLIKFFGPLSFGVAHLLPTRLSEFSDFKHLVIDFSNAHVIGTTSSLAIESVICSSLSLGRGVYLSGIHANTERVFSRLGVLDLIPPENKCKDSILAILKAGHKLKG